MIFFSIYSSKGSFCLYFNEMPSFQVLYVSLNIWHSDELFKNFIPAKEIFLFFTFQWWIKFDNEMPSFQIKFDFEKFAHCTWCGRFDLYKKMSNFISICIMGALRLYYARLDFVAVHNWKSAADFDLLLMTMRYNS